MTKQKFDVEYVENFFSETKRGRNYIKFHKLRYCYLLNHLYNIVEKTGFEKVKIIDVGPMHQTVLFRASISNLHVDTLGYNHITNNLAEGEKHIEVDLNKTDEYQQEILEQYDVIVFSEVMEHLYTKPEIVISFLMKFLKPEGSIILQTPNGLAIHHRIKLLFGIHPYQLINEERSNHYREYTTTEMENIFSNCGLNVIHRENKNYFNNERTFLNRAYVKMEKIIPHSFRDGITIIGQRK